MLGQGPEHQSRAPRSASTRHRQWDLALDDVLRGSVVIAGDGTIYAQTSYSRTADKPAKLHAISRDGLVKWAIPIQSANGWYAPTPALGADGQVLVGDDRELRAYTPRGNLAWQVSLSNGVLGAPTVGGDGTIFVATVDGPLYAISPAGTVLRSFKTRSDSRYSSPAVRSDGRLVVMQMDTYSSFVDVFGVDGSAELHVDGLGFTELFANYTVQAANGTTYVAVDKGVSAVSVSGARQWQVAGVGTPPAVGADGTVYVAMAGAEMVTALAPDGSRKWGVASASGRAAGALAIAGDDTIYAAGDKLYAISPDGALLDTVETGSPISSKLAIDFDGTVVFGTADKMLHAR
jgi:outer membrane protein assembly factor BamB